MLRVLCIDETPKERAERKLDPALLDHLTWPAYVWEFLALTEDPLMVEEWVHRVPADKRPGAGSTEHGGKKGSGGGKSRKAAPAAQADGAADGEATDAEPAPRRKSFAPLSAEERAAMDAVLEAADPAVPALPPAAETFSAPGVPPQPAPAPTEYHRLPVGLKATILSRLCDHLLDCLTIRAEVDRREAAGELVAGKGGAGGAFPIMTEEERKAAEEKVGGEGAGGRAGPESAELDVPAEACIISAMLLAWRSSWVAVRPTWPGPSMGPRPQVAAACSGSWQPLSALNLPAPARAFKSSCHPAPPARPPSWS